MTKRQREILELRDACMLLVAQRGNQREMNGAPIMEVTLGPFTIWLTPGGVRRKLDVWHAGNTKVLDLGWSAGQTHEISRLKAALKRGARAYRDRRGGGQIANLRCVDSGCSCTASSLTAPRALIPLISCVCSASNGHSG